MVQYGWFTGSRLLGSVAILVVATGFAGRTMLLSAGAQQRGTTNTQSAGIAEVALTTSCRADGTCRSENTCLVAAADQVADAKPAAKANSSAGKNREQAAPGRVRIVAEPVKPAMPQSAPVFQNFAGPFNDPFEPPPEPGIRARPDSVSDFRPGRATASSIPAPRPMPEVRTIMVPHQRTVEIRLPNGNTTLRTVTVYEPELVPVQPMPGQPSPDPFGFEEPADALSVVRSPRLDELRAAFEEKLNLLLTDELDAEISRLNSEVRELEAQTRMRALREQLATLQRQLPETAPARAAADMLAVPVPRVIEQRNWVTTPKPSSGPFHIQPSGF